MMTQDYAIINSPQHDSTLPKDHWGLKAFEC